MKTLWLLRHAKSSWERGGEPDHERPLDARGRDAALRLGRHFARNGLRPDLVLCSSALRARQTLEGVLEGLDDGVPVEMEDDLYLASSGELLRRVQRAPEGAASLLLVGHNPGIGELAVRLAKRGAGDREGMRRRYPTGGLAELRSEASRWCEIDPGRGCELAAFVRPRTLPA